MRVHYFLYDFRATSDVSHLNVFVPLTMIAGRHSELESPYTTKGIKVMGTCMQKKTKRVTWKMDGYKKKYDANLQMRR